jgi:hypothetical protein
MLPENLAQLLQRPEDHLLRASARYRLDRVTDRARGR